MINNIHFRTLFRTNSKISILFLALPLIYSCNSNPQNRPSPLRVENIKVDSVAIELAYSSPAVRGRSIFGNGPDFLEPYGELWRTGANKATSIQLSADILIDSIKIDSGKYSIFTIPDEDEWTLIINKNWDQWGEYDYQDSLDVLRIKVPRSKLSTKQERMRLFIENNELKFAWEFSAWNVPIASLP